MRKHVGMEKGVRLSGVSAIQGFSMYRSLCIYDPDGHKCPLYRGCPPLRGVR